MSTSSRKGYVAEHLSELWLESHLGVDLERPRAGAPADRGDLIGIPLTLSVKNRRADQLGTWVDEMTAMTARNGHQSGVVIHKRVGRGKPSDWFFTTTGDLWIPMARAFLDQAPCSDCGGTHRPANVHGPR